MKETKALSKWYKCEFCGLPFTEDEHEKGIEHEKKHFVYKGGDIKTQPYFCGVSVPAEIEIILENELGEKKKAVFYSKEHWKFNP